MVAASLNTRSPTPHNADFVKRYHAAYGADPENWAGIGYAMMYLVAAAIRDAGPFADRDTVRKALAASSNVPTVLGDGRYTLNANRNASYGATLITVRNGQFVAVPI